MPGESENFWPSAVPPRWGGTSGAARNMPRQDPLNSALAGNFDGGIMN